MIYCYLLRMAVSWKSYAVAAHRVDRSVTKFAEFMLATVETRCNVAHIYSWS
jgi:hypothetical protein